MANYDSLLRGYTTCDRARFSASDENQLAAEKTKADNKAPPAKPLDVLATRKRKGPPTGLFNRKVFNVAR